MLSWRCSIFRSCECWFNSGGTTRIIRTVSWCRFSALYVIWERRRELSELTPKPSIAGLLVLLCSITVLFVGSLGAELFLARISLLGVIVGLLLFLHGWPIVKHLAFPLSALLLMIPIPGVIYYQLVFPLQLLASELAAGALQVQSYHAGSARRQHTGAAQLTA